MSESVHLCLSDLLDQDLSSYEYFHSLPSALQDQLLELEISSFDQLQDYAARIKAGERIE